MPHTAQHNFPLKGELITLCSYLTAPFLVLKAKIIDRLNANLPRKCASLTFRLSFLHCFLIRIGTTASVTRRREVIIGYSTSLTFADENNLKLSK